MWKPQGLQGNMYFPEALKKIHRKMRPGLVSVVLRKRADEDSDGTPGGVAVQPPQWTSPRALLLWGGFPHGLMALLPEGFVFFPRVYICLRWTLSTFLSLQKSWFLFCFQNMFSHVIDGQFFFFQYFESVVHCLFLLRCLQRQAYHCI